MWDMVSLSSIDKLKYLPTAVLCVGCFTCQLSHTVTMWSRMSQVIGVGKAGLDPLISRSQGGRLTTRPLKRLLVACLFHVPATR